MFTQINLKDRQMHANSYAYNPSGVSVFDASPAMASKIVNDRKLHDSNFAFVQTALAKLHEKVYEPKWNTTYAQDIPVKVGGGLVDFVEYYTVEWFGQGDETTLVGNNVNQIQRVNARANAKKVNVFTYEIAYGLKFVEVEKLNKVNFTKSLETIYKDAIVAGFDIFVNKIAYLGADGDDGLLTSDDRCPVSLIPAGTLAPAEQGFAQMTDAEIVALINGIIADSLIQTNMNLALIPDNFLMPVTDAAELTSRFSVLYTATLREFIMGHNMGIDESKAAGIEDYRLKLKGRPQLEGAGTNSTGRLVVYRYNEDFLRLDIPYAISLYITLPDITSAEYVSLFVGQVSQVQLMYNTDNTDLTAPVKYFDFAAKVVAP